MTLLFELSCGPFEKQTRRNLQQIFLHVDHGGNQIPKNDARVVKSNKVNEWLNVE